jgi:hypothetical protein
MKTGIELIAAERQRQIDVERYRAYNDDKQTSGELAIAAACYAVHDINDHGAHFEVLRLYGHGDPREGECEDAWPWGADFDKREEHSPLRKRIIAGALMAAEIDRMLRAGITE